MAGQKRGRGWHGRWEGKPYNCTGLGESDCKWLGCQDGCGGLSAYAEGLVTTEWFQPRGTRVLLGDHLPLLPAAIWWCSSPWCVGFVACRLYTLSEHCAKNKGTENKSFLYLEGVITVASWCRKPPHCLLFQALQIQGGPSSWLAICWALRPSDASHHWRREDLVQRDCPLLHGTPEWWLPKPQLKWKQYGRSNIGKRLWGGTARRADSNWPKTRSLPHNITFSYKTVGWQFSQGSHRSETGWASVCQWEVMSDSLCIIWFVWFSPSFIKLPLSQPKGFSCLPIMLWRSEHITG